MRRIVLTRLASLAIAAGGCGRDAATPAPARSIPWAEYQTMDAEQKDDPYVVDHLDADARQKLAAAQKKKR